MMVIKWWKSNNNNKKKWRRKKNGTKLPKNNNKEWKRQYLRIIDTNFALIITFYVINYARVVFYYYYYIKRFLAIIINNQQCHTNNTETIITKIRLCRFLHKLFYGKDFQLGASVLKKHTFGEQWQLLQNVRILNFDSHSVLLASYTTRMKKK